MLICKFVRRDSTTLVAIFGCFCLLAPCRGEGLITVTFGGEPTQPPGSRYYRTNYYERGTSFVGECGRAFPPSSAGWPDNGTAYIVPSWPGMNCSRLDGLSFRLVSVDLAVYSDVFPDDPASFEGHRPDGSVVTTNFPVSGLAFQTYYFSSEFANVTNVLIAAGAVDNLKFQLPTVHPFLSISTSHSYSYTLLTLQAQGALGLRYRMEYADSLPPTNWIALTDFESSFYKVEQVSTNLPPQRFFRVVELP